MCIVVVCVLFEGATSSATYVENFIIAHKALKHQVRGLLEKFYFWFAFNMKAPSFLFFAWYHPIAVWQCLILYWYGGVKEHLNENKSGIYKSGRHLLCRFIFIIYYSLKTKTKFNSPIQQPLYNSFATFSSFHRQRTRIKCLYFFYHKIFSTNNSKPKMMRWLQ